MLDVGIDVVGDSARDAVPAWLGSWLVLDEGGGVRHCVHFFVGWDVGRVVCFIWF